ncbi:MAG: glycosyltransferase [Fimbriimonadaceae bacterium]|nr:glycosyltransferase [Fimbriimonadaceae bacterium]
MPRLLKGRKTAHSVLCNRRREDLEAVARDAEFIEQFIGIDPARVTSTDGGSDPWPDLTATGRPVLLHVGHLKRNRGLDVLADAKRLLADQIEVVVQGSPALPPDAGVLEDLESAGVRVRRTFEPNLHRLYKAADLYVFPVQQVSAGAIELPLGVLEAIANQTPVLTTDFGVLRRALDGLPGVTFGTRDEFLSSLRSLVAGTGLRNKPHGLPDHLHADRTAEAVLQMVEK